MKEERRKRALLSASVSRPAEEPLSCNA